ncbi:MAG TPA: efflux RND transporter periplasmic adaptor subunit [Cyclobacteriaceae bacterium]|nr:efflux RND transporter periplasmic adaptor subunit [Cyclobacteriaceae bacterium]
MTKINLKIAQAFVLLILFAMGCNAKKQGVVAPRRQGPILVDGFSVQPQNVSENVEVPGTLLPQEETQIRAEVSGRVTNLNIPEGGVVPKGKILVKLFDGDLQAQLKKLEVQLQISEKSEERQGELLKINGISQQDYDLAALSVENLKADILATRIAISKTEIRAPYAGKLGLRYVSLGAYLSPSEIITTIRQVDQLKLEFAVPEKYARNISKGYQVKFKVDGGQQFHFASVLATENSVDETTRTLKVRAIVKESHPELVPGAFARVSLQLGRTDNALMIPTQAVIPQARNKQVIIYKNDSVQFKIVETGLRDSAFVQITSGLQQGDTVIITGLMAIRPNAKVKLGRVLQY